MEATNNTPKYEPQVVIMGAGVVGLMTALQLEKRGIRVLIIDRVVNKKKYYKVGESLLIFSNPFLRTVGGLNDFCNECHPKLGVWNTWDMEYKDTFEGRPEFTFIGNNTPKRWVDAFVSRQFFEATGVDVQVSRPEAEELLAKHVREKGIWFVDNGFVKEVTISKDGGVHTVRWEEEGKAGLQEIQCAWVIDCAGRKRILAKQMGHVAEEKEFDDGFRSSGVWGHFENVREDQFAEWKAHFTDGMVQDRDKFTVHLWGRGYWIWVIRLNQDRLSLGVCFDKKAPIAGKTYEDMFWDVINRYPLLRRVATKENMLQFASYKDMQYISDTFIHENRYAIVGDAAASIDAFYSQGMSVSLVISFHVNNVIERDLKEKVIDRDYVRRINDHAVNEFHMQRSTVKYKYTKAIEDSRFFILAHFMDLLYLSAGTVPRHLLIKWLLETDAGRNEGEKGRKMREKLSRKLFYTASYPYVSLFGPRAVSRWQYALQEGLAKRAIWRLENGVKVPRLRFIFRFLSKPARLDKLFKVGKPENFVDITPDLMKMVEPGFMRITGREESPISLWIGVNLFLPLMCIFLYFYDWLDTALLKLWMNPSGREGMAPETKPLP